MLMHYTCTCCWSVITPIAQRDVKHIFYWWYSRKKWQELLFDALMTMWHLNLALSFFLPKSPGTQIHSILFPTVLA